MWVPVSVVQDPPKLPRSFLPRHSETSETGFDRSRSYETRRDKERQEKGMCQPYKRFRNFADAGSLQRKLNFGKFLSAIPRRARCQRRIISSLEGTARVTYCSPPYHTSGNSRIPFFVLHNVVVVARTENDMSHARLVSRRFTTGLGYCKNDLQSTIQQVNEIG